MNPKDSITTSEWMMLKRETKSALAAIFGITRTGFSQTVTDATGHSTFMTDGFTHKDLAVMTFDRLMTFVGESLEGDNIHTLFLRAVDKIEVAPVEIETIIQKQEAPLPTPTVPLREPKDPGINGYKCDKEGCAFATASKIALSMHTGRFHKINT